MKKLLFTFSLLVAISSFALAQGTVNINGYVTDANGNAMGGYPVEVMSDSLTGLNFYTMTYTNNNGYYSVNANVGMLTQGGFYVWTQDSCSMGYIAQTVYYNPAMMTISNVDFNICPNGSGGSNCAAAFTHSVNPNGVVTFAGSATGGQAPYTYNWTLGNGVSTSGGATTSTTYSNGMYLACLTITDATGCMNTYCDTISVNTGGGGSNCAASFSYQTTAIGTTVFTGSATGGQGPYSYYWTLDNGATATGQVVTAVYNTPGIYFPCLTITDATGCINTYCDSLVIGNGGGGCSASMSYSTNNTLSVNFSVNATGTAPFLYAWDFGDSMGTSMMANPTYTYGANGTYSPCVTITDANGCVSTTCSMVTLYPVTSGSLNVLVVSDSLSGPTQAVVYLIEHDTVAGTLTAIQVDTTLQGFATFTNIPFGNYLVKAALLSSDPNYSSYLPTYYTYSLNWSNATNVQVTPNFNNFMYLDLVPGNNIGTGPGFIGGLITQGANGPGDPVDGAQVILYDANMNPIAYTYTDEDGEYSFDNLPYGVYFIYVEGLGLISSTIEVTLSPTTPSMDQVHFEVGSTYVMFTSTNEILSVSGLKVYPNPVTDQLYMQFDLDQALDADISIINVTGQVISNFQRTLNSGNNLIQVSTNELPAGVYSIHLKSEAGIITQKFIKQ